MAPPWYQVARKALVATLVAFVVSGGVILAAVADDHVSTSEWVTIALALAANIVGPYGVYKATNAPQPGQPALPPPVRSYGTGGVPDRDTRPDWWTDPL